MDFLNELNQSQIDAVTFCDGASLVIAGAGSGKTRVLTYKIAYLLSKGVQPYRILALTFTNKAAKEMRDRIDTLLGSDISRSLWMNTFHSIFSRFLRTEAEHIGFKQNFTIYDSTDAKNLVKSIIEQIGLDKKTYDFKFIAWKISMLKNKLVLPKSYDDYPEYVAQDKAMKTPMFKKIYKFYMKQCQDANVMDFDDLLLYTNILFSSHPEILEKYQNLFQYILVDEYQDTNLSQYLIIKKLADKHKRLCVVGDDAQSIYSFRGARIENIFNFQKDYSDYKLFKLEQNYRSTKNIVNIANSLIEKNKNRIPKKIFSDNEDGSKIIYRKLETDRTEGGFVAEQIKLLLLRDHHKLSECAVLYRANYQSRIIEEALRTLNINYKVWGGISFYDRAEIKNVIAYIRLCVNNLDVEAFKRIVNYPLRKIGQTTVDKLLVYSFENNISLWDLLVNIDTTPIDLNNGTKRKLTLFTNMIADLSAKIDTISASDFILELVKVTGLEKDLHEDSTPEGVSRFENLQELLNGIKAFCEDTDYPPPKGYEFNTISQYLEHISLLTNNEDTQDGKNESVTLMTIHSAKGLEFDNVFIIGLVNGKFPRAKMGEMITEAEIEEERRLFYVAITRARKNLFITGHTMGFYFGSMEHYDESRFIRDLDPTFLDIKQRNSNPFACPDDNTNKYRNDVFVAKPKVNLAENKTEKKTFPQKTAVNFDQRQGAVSDFVSNNSSLKVGQNVRHEQFGDGTVHELLSDRVRIDFNGQIKTLLLQFAKLEKID